MDRLRTPRPLGTTLPALYLDDTYVQGICEVADELLAPAFLVLDSYHAYLDPTTSPTDALEWLAGWLGLDLRPEETPPRKRELVRAGAELLRWRGTATGLRDTIRAALGFEAEVLDAGGAWWSDKPSSNPATPSDADVTVRVPTTGAQQVDLAALDAIIRTVVPAHTTFRIEVVQQNS